jgi:hypothetical protein
MSNRSLRLAAAAFAAVLALLAYLVQDALDQRLRGGGGAHFGAGDEIGEHVAALGPALRFLGPIVECGGLVAGLGLFLGAHQPRIGEIRGGLVDHREFVVIGEHDRDAMAARDLDEARILEALVAHFQRMAERAALHLARQQLQERLDVFGIERLRLHELPVDRTEPVAELVQALVDEHANRFAGRREQFAVGDVARALDGEDEALRRLVAPLDPARRLEGGVVGAVDLQRGELAAGIFELALLGQLLRIEDAAPRLEGPAADSDVDLA